MLFRLFSPPIHKNTVPFVGLFGVLTSGSNANSACPNATVPDCQGGTLGALVTRGGTQYILSNAHVLAGLSGGMAILQPGLKDVGCNPAHTTSVANLSQFTNPQTDTGAIVDAAIAQVASGAVDPSGSILEMGSTVANGIPQPGAPAQGTGMAASVNQLVAKSGRSTGLTCSNVEAVNVSAKVTFPSFCSSPGFTATFPNEITVSNTGFAANGDSGSLVVDASTAQPVALQFAGDSATSLGNPVSDVLNALKDASGNTPTFVGGAPHAVAACNLPAPTTTVSQARLTASQETTSRAEGVKNLHASELLANAAVAALGVGPSLDVPGEPALILFIRKDAARGPLPSEVDGVRTRLIQSQTFSSEGLLDFRETEQLILQASAERSKALPGVEIRRAQAVKERYAPQWFSDPAIEAVGVSASLDSPGDAALIFYILKDKPHVAIPATVEGLRTRFKETIGFTAGIVLSPSSAACPAVLRQRIGIGGPADKLRQ